MLLRFLTGELGIKNVLLDDVAELGVRVVFDVDPILAVVAGPNMDAWDPAGVEGWAILVMAD